ncbi:ribonuclease HI family protein [Paenarthrobacter sp. Z7-10]|uniref:ribonuclease HI family protein n=1 Tax=Paenarthrobacter sp. Z7-10 TaxID=2787635 RepID=UPI0022A923B4|nr:ribonuclease HI family protein [Paenarthrobacter sp. Z7-10]MCZ2402588.1 ribonuclease HI family protein [Paenarthrobacter sp. Z7-10]
MTIVAAADGSALGNPGPAGWAWYVNDSCWRAGGWPHGTNNQGELMAVLDLLRSTAHLPQEHLRILCDSQYVINCVSKWTPGWKRKGWRKADGKPVLNVDLLKDIDAAISGRNYSFEWVKGHAGHDLNEAADVRARAVATAYQSQSPVPRGPGFPGALDTETDVDNGPGVESPGSDEAPNSEGLKSGQQFPSGSYSGAAADAEPDLFSSLADEDIAPLEISPREAVVALERELLAPSTRADASRLAVLLHPDFEEIGQSGRMWTRDAMLAALEDESAAEATMEVLNVDVLDGSTALLTYRSAGRRGSALRTSLWRLSGSQWKLRFHQGTPES